VAEPVVLINSFEVPPPDAENFITAWEKTRDYLESQPGYIETALHQAVTPGAEFEFVNIARWRTPQDFMAAIQSPGFAQAAAGLAGYPAHPALYDVVRT
jgi:heme oxygenase (mycobilin-producing)